MSDLSIDYYDTHGQAFFDGSVSADMSPIQTRFLAHVPAGGEILEGGCGSGRDALAFARAGYAVTAFDGSERMVALATEHTGLPVVHLRFEDVAWRDRFNGIWTSASLLHVSRADLPAVLARLAAALKPGGVWMLSFKLGETERLSSGRRFTDMTEPMLARAVEGAGLDLVELWTDADVRPGRAEEYWVAAIARRPAGRQAILNLR